MSDKKEMAAPKKTKNDILLELFDGRVVGGALSELANYSELFIKMSEAVFLVDRNSLRVLECNPAALTLFQVVEDEVLGHELPHLFGNDALNREVLTSNLLRFQKDTQFRFNGDLEFKNTHGDDQSMEVSGACLKILDYIEVIQIIVKDVTEIRRAQRELHEMNEALKALSTTDAMTGLRNYRYFKEMIASVHHHAVASPQSYGVIFIDVDHFKKYNDHNGHPAGDRVLKTVAALIKSACHAQDTPCRYGGEEFVVLCRNSNIEVTAALAEKIRRSIESTDFEFGEHQPLKRVTVSMGVSAFPSSQGADWEKTLKHADEALYVAKEKGRNQVMVYDILKLKAAA